MNFILPMITLVFCMISSAIYLTDIKKHNCLEVQRSVKRYLIVMTIVTIGISVRMNEWNIINMKRMALLSVLWPISFSDYHFFRIPNSLIFLGFLFRGILLLPEIRALRVSAWKIWGLELFITGVLFVTSLGCSVCRKNSIGFGDIKLLSVMGLLLDWCSLFYTVLTALLISLFFKRRTGKEAVPFGFSLAAGAFFAVCFQGGKKCWK